ncbi:MAG TPA: efflux RND transporter permease subunit [Candidatus Deferrimicrobium sp.]|nr:efflux RND transporter permease subunit [Candidatus Deferrimicrobium sp.]
MIRLTQFALREKSVMILLAVGIFLAGIYSWGQLRQELIPDIELPFVTIITPLPGAGAEDVASQVTEPVERSLANVPRMETMQSTSSNSLSLVFAQFDFGTDLKETIDNVEAAVAQAELPEGVEPQVSSFDFNSQPIIVATVGPVEGVDPVEAAAITRDEVVPALLGIEGVSTAELTGGATPILDIVLDPAKMAEHGISLQQVQGILFANQITIPSGSIDEGSLRLPVSTEHRFDSIEALETQIVGASAPSGAMGAAPAAEGDSEGGLQLPDLGQLSEALAAIPMPVTLGQIATIEEREVNASGYARTDGQPSLTVSITKRSGANTISVADEVEAVFDDVREQHGDVISIAIIQDQSQFIRESQTGLVQEGLLGALFAIIVIYIFLRSARTTLVAAISIPLSILMAIAVFGIAGLSINILTLGGLAVAVGRVVDDSIVVLENIYRHRGMGDDKKTAVLNGTKEVAGAITSSTITTVAVFLPLGFVGGIVSQFFLPFGLAVTFALLASLLVALTVIPVLAYWFVDKTSMKLGPDGEPEMTIWQRLYTPVLVVALRNRLTKWGTLGVATVLFVIAMALAPLLPTSFIDAGGENFLSVTVSPPQGSSTAGVQERTIQAEEILMANEDVELVQSTIPGDADTGAQALQAAFAGRASNSAVLIIRLADDVDLGKAREDIKLSLAPVAQDGFEVTISEQDFTGAGGGLAIVVSGQNASDIKLASDLIVRELKMLDGVDNVASDAVAEAPQISVAVDANKAAMIGSSTAQIGSALRSVLVGQSIGSYSLEDGQVVETILRLDDEGVDGVEGLRALPVSGTVGTQPLGQVANVEQVEIQGTVTRVDGAPAATISADITTEDTGAVSMEAQAIIDELQAVGAIPEGVTTTFAGATAQMNEAFGGLFFSMGVAILAVYVVMVLALGSLLTPFIILFSLPLALIGAIPALLVTGNPLGISAMIGFLMLIGIVVTNAIVLLDFVEQLRERGVPTTEALVRGANTRVRPILMTAIATILALSPVALGFAHGSIIAAELAVVVIGGLFTSTFLTLMVIPVIYSLVDGGKEGFRKRFMRGDADEQQAEAGSPPPAPAAAQG